VLVETFAKGAAGETGRKGCRSAKSNEHEEVLVQLPLIIRCDDPNDQLALIAPQLSEMYDTNSLHPVERAYLKAAHLNRHAQMITKKI